jgi:hypothetical protein
MMSQNADCIVCEICGEMTPEKSFVVDSEKTFHWICIPCRDKLRKKTQGWHPVFLLDEVEKAKFGTVIDIAEQKYSQAPEEYLEHLSDSLEPHTHCCECTPGPHFELHFVHIQYPNCTCEKKNYRLQRNTGEF